MLASSPFAVLHSGPFTVIGLVVGEIDQLNLAEFRDEALHLIRRSRCRTLGIDMTGLKIIPSGLLGLLVTIHQEHVSVCLLNPSQDLRDVLEITRLNRLFPAYRFDC